MPPARKQPTPPDALTTYAAQELARRPSGPRPRSLGDERAIYTGDSVRLVRVTTNEDDEYYLTVSKPLTTDTVDGERMFVSQAQADRLLSAGFDDISDRANGSAWRADAQKAHKIGSDLNVIAVMLDAKGDRLAASRSR